jgi:hypothetical protein
MIQIKSVPGGRYIEIKVFDSKTLKDYATISVRPYRNDTPGTLSICSLEDIPADYVDEITRALQEAWRIAKGYLIIS